VELVSLPEFLAAEDWRKCWSIVTNNFEEPNTGDATISIALFHLSDVDSDNARTGSTLTTSCDNPKLVDEALRCISLLVRGSNEISSNADVVSVAIETVLFADKSLGANCCRRLYAPCRDLSGTA
jgi:hypothetical protein